MDHLGFSHSIRRRGRKRRRLNRSQEKRQVVSEEGRKERRERQTEAARSSSASHELDCFSSFAERFTIFLSSSSPPFPPLFCGLIRTCSREEQEEEEEEGVIVQNSRLVSKISSSIFVGVLPLPLPPLSRLFWRVSAPSSSRSAAGRSL